VARLYQKDGRQVKKVVIGVDMGGTKISVKLIDARARVLASATLPTLKDLEAHESVRTLRETVASMVTGRAGHRARLAGIGIGLPGPVDSKKGRVPWSPNMQGWEGIPLRSILEKAFKVPVILDNDCNAAGFGEKCFGVGKKARDFIYITVSTGIGGGLVLGGKVHRGASFCGGEVGHMTIVPGGELCNCGKHGCVEAYASGTAIARDARERIRRGAKSRLLELGGRLGEITSEIVAKGARLGDVLALEVLRQAGRYLGIGLANLINILNPEVVAIGGSVMKASPYIWKPMMEAARAESWPVAFRACRIQKTSLGDDVVNLGAAALVFAAIG
jgi:glucokinase